MPLTRHGFKARHFPFPRRSGGPQSVGAEEEETMIDPDSVRPSKWEDVVLLYDDGDFSVITGRYDGGTAPAYGVRWNGIPGDEKDRGYPNTFSHPGWFVIPSFLAEPMLHSLLSESLRHPRLERFNTAILNAIRATEHRVHPNTIQYAIALYGAANTGKTMTLNTLIDILVSESVQEDGGGVVATENINYDSNTKTGDRHVAIRVFGKLIVVITGGDCGDAVQKGLEFAVRFNADILVAATRKRSDSYSWGAFFDSVVVEAGIPYDAIEKVFVQNHLKAQAQAKKQADEIVEFLRQA